MDQQTFTIARRSDGDLGRALDALLKDHQNNPVTYEWLNPGSATAAYSTLLTEDVWKSLITANATSISRLAFHIPGYQIHYFRGGEQGLNWPTMDQIRATVHQDGCSLQVRIASLDRLNQQFPPVSLRTVNSPASESDELRAIEQSRLQRLTELTEKFFEQGLKYKNELELDQREKQKAADQALIDARKALQAEIDAERDALKVREGELQVRRDELDDKDNTHARRGIREKMLQDIRERVDTFGVSRATSKKRLPVMTAMWLLCIFLAASFVWTADQLNRVHEVINTQVAKAEPGAKGVSAPIESAVPKPVVNEQSQERWFIWLRLAVTGAGFVAAILYYIKWEDSWARRHAEAEFNLRQFQIDLNRASWVVETCLAWKKEAEGHIPSELLKSITKGLFDSSQTQSDPVLHPADELASALLGTASKLKLNTPGGELEFNKPGKIPKEAVAGK